MEEIRCMIYSRCKSYKVVVMDSVFDEGKVTSERLPWFSAFF